jgi:hypothetical protein
MSLPDFLSASDVEDLMLRLGLSLDRGSIARALRPTSLEGVIPPGRSGQAWVIPTDQLFHLLVICLARRASRGTNRGGRGRVDLPRLRLTAAEYLMPHPEPARMMPKPLKRAVRERQKERARPLGLFSGL